MSKSKLHGGRRDYYWPFLFGVSVPVKYFISRANPTIYGTSKNFKEVSVVVKGRVISRGDLSLKHGGPDLFHRATWLYTCLTH